MHERSSFLTLTYDNDNLPDRSSASTNRGYLAKCYRDVQLFHKRMRETLGEFRHYTVGEFGDKNFRVHWHGIYFGLGFDDGVQVAGGDDGPVFKSEGLERVWQRGLASYGDVHPNTIRYVVNYLQKPIRGECVRVPFARMSRMPGIGRPWFDAYWRDVFPLDEVVVEGRKVPAPGVYLDWLEDKDSDMAAEVRERRRLKGQRQFERLTYTRRHGLLDAAELRQERKHSTKELHREA